MGDDDRASHHEPHRKRVHEFVARHAQFDRPAEMVTHAVVATKDEGSDEAEELLGGFRERSVLVRQRIEGVQTFDDAVVGAEDPLVETGTFGGEFFGSEAHVYGPRLGEDDLDSRRRRGAVRGAARETIRYNAPDLSSFPSAPDAMSARPRFLVCPPTYYDVHYCINPWMQNQLHRVNHVRAAQQWLALRSTLARHADVVELEPVHGLPDMVFTANAGFVYRQKVVVSRFLHPERQGETGPFADAFRRLGFEVDIPPEDVVFEGAGDTLYDARRGFAWAGSGQRSTRAAHRYVEEATGCPLVSLTLVNPSFYHLDTCLCPLPGGEILYYPPAFDDKSRALIAAHTSADERIEIDDYEAGILACNMVPIGRLIVVHALSERLLKILEPAGYAIELSPLDEFHRAGGSARCLTLRLDTEPGDTV
jgi:N-dimethylarginine dimethylaminohydrolase